MAIINNDRKFIFVHIPKCAGTSVGMLLSQYNGLGDIELGVTEFGQALSPLYYKRFGVRKHSTGSELKEAIGKHKWSQYYTFSFVRHPIGKLSSAYRFLKYSWKGWKGSEIMNDYKSFEDFVMSDFFLSPGPDRIFAPQFRFCYDTNNECLLNFIGKVEQLEIDVKSLLENLNISDNYFKMRKHNEGKKKKSNEKISNDCLNRIVKRYGKDFELFKYETSRQWD